MSKIIHQRNKCIGCGACAAVCPKFFEMAEDGMAKLKNAVKAGENFELETDEISCAKDAAEACPVKIIQVQ